MQVESQFGVRKGALEMVAHIVRNDGFLGLYYGVCDDLMSLPCD
jgi:hypothetical protein